MQIEIFLARGAPGLREHSSLLITRFFLRRPSAAFGNGLVRLGRALRPASGRAVAPIAGIDAETAQPAAPLEFRGKAKLEDFVCPLPAIPDKVAVIGGGFRKSKNVRMFDAADDAPLRAWSPDVLVAPMPAVLALAESRLTGADFPALMAIVVVTSLNDAPLEERHRELFWEAFQAPLFEQLRAWDGRIIARECEVHDGLHLVEKAVVTHSDEGELLLTLMEKRKKPTAPARTGLVGEIVREICDCGAETPRLRNLAAAKTIAALS